MACKLTIETDQKRTKDFNKVKKLTLFSQNSLQEIVGLHISTFDLVTGYTKISFCSLSAVVC